MHISAEPKPATVSEHHTVFSLLSVFADDRGFFVQQCDPEIVQQIQRAEQEQLLKLFIALLRRVSETNDRLLVARNFEPSAASPVTAFYVEELPSEFTEIDLFVRDVCRNVGPSNLALVTTMIYVDRILKRTSTYVTSHSVHKLFVGALIVASREVDEVIIAPSLLREMTGMTELEQAQLHKAVLDAIQYKLDVTAEELMVYFDRVLFDS